MAQIVIRKTNLAEGERVGDVVSIYDDSTVLSGAFCESICADNQEES